MSEQKPDRRAGSAQGRDKEVVTLRRLASLLAGGAVFLLLGAIPALADGGPHTLTGNSGQAGISSDSCAGCHRAHTAKGAFLLVEEESSLCLTCHGGTGNGATTDVMNGVQYQVGQTQGTGAILGALRAGGFANARIDSDSAGRLTYNSTRTNYPLSNVQFVPVLAAGQAVTSRHLDPLAPASAQAWGQGAIGSGTGTSITLECVSCHNPHGNGQYRILNPSPGDGSGAFPEASAKTVTDVAGGPTGTYNYTVIQKPGTGVTSTSDGDPASYLRYASDVVAGGYSDTVGDYFHRQVPWFGRTDATDPLTRPGGVKYPATGYNSDAPNAHPSDTDATAVNNSFNSQITAWCAQCHTRYDTSTGTQPASGHGSYDTASGDSTFMYRHGTSRTACTTCHVAHGSNAQMTGAYSSEFPYPNDTTDASSRLLKIDNRGTCQACHDPTGTVLGGTYVGPTPAPAAP